MLRNAFDLLATEGTLRQILRAITFPRNTQDVLRVNVDNTVTVSGTVAMNNAATGNTMQGAGTHPAFWGAVSWNTVDARYAFGEQQIATYIQNRERWTFS